MAQVGTNETVLIIALMCIAVALPIGVLLLLLRVTRSAGQRDEATTLCRHCGGRVAEPDRFCRHCGQPLRAA